MRVVGPSSQVSDVGRPCVRLNRCGPAEAAAAACVAYMPRCLWVPFQLPHGVRQQHSAYTFSGVLFYVDLTGHMHPTTKLSRKADHIAYLLLIIFVDSQILMVGVGTLGKRLFKVSTLH